MTQRANPSVNRHLEAFKTAGAIALAGGSADGWISPSSETSDISVQDPAIDDEVLNAFEQSSTNSSLTVTIDAGEAFVYGSWIVKDTPTDITLAPDLQSQTIFVGWNNNKANDVIVGLVDDFNNGPNDVDQRIPLYDITTDNNGVTNVVDRRAIGKLIYADEVDVDEKLGLPVFENTDNASVEEGAAVYIDGTGSQIEGIYVYTGSADEWDRVARSNEEVEDLINELLTAGTGTTITYDDSNDNLIIDGATQYTDELAQDAIASLLVAGNGITLSYNDTEDSLTASIPTNAIQLDEIDESISPTWTGTHTFNNAVQQSVTPTADNELATKSYVDSTEQGLDIHESVRVASTSNIDLTSSTDPNPIDGITVSNGDRILLKNQATDSENGVYDAVTATDPSTWVRSSDADEDSEVVDGFFVFVESGTTQQSQSYIIVNNPTLGTDPVSFTQFADAATISAGDALTKSGDTISHRDTSNQSAVSASAGSAITDVSVDEYGHTTSVSTSSFDTRYVERSGDDISSLTVTEDIDASTSSEFVTAQYASLLDAQNATLTEGALVYVEAEQSFYLQDADGLVKIPTIEAVVSFVNNNSDVPIADVARGFEARTSYPENPESGRVIFRTDKTETQ